MRVIIQAGICPPAVERIRKTEKEIRRIVGGEPEIRKVKYEYMDEAVGDVLNNVRVITRKGLDAHFQESYDAPAIFCGETRGGKMRSLTDKEIFCIRRWVFWYF